MPRCILQLDQTCFCFQIPPILSVINRLSQKPPIIAKPPFCFMEIRLEVITGQS